MTKDEQYREILEKIHAITQDNNLGAETNICQLLSLLKHELDLYWAGLYMMEKGELKLGIFQGEIACTRIQTGQGVCGTAALKEETVIVPDVSKFPGYIACHSAPLSEIVVPGFVDGKLAFVLDLDSIRPAFFDETDKKYLEKVVEIISAFMPRARLS